MKTRKLFLAVLIAITALTVGATGCKKRDAKPAPQVPASASVAAANTPALQPGGSAASGR